MQERPKLNLELSQADKAFEIIGWILILSNWGLTIANYQSLPDVIPTHFNGAGVADQFGDKWMILTLPFIASVLFVGLTNLNKFPHIYNYPTGITSENALRQYTNATRLIRYLKVIIAVIFGLISFQIISTANGQKDDLGTWFLPMTMGMLVIPTIYYLIKSLKG
jgi:uncharacterized membrane protein